MHIIVDFARPLVTIGTALSAFGLLGYAITLILL
jgi:hypothetical protein